MQEQATTQPQNMNPPQNLEVMKLNLVKEGRHLIAEDPTGYTVAEQLDYEARLLDWRTRSQAFRQKVRESQP